MLQNSSAIKFAPKLEEALKKLKDILRQKLDEFFQQGFAFEIHADTSSQRLGAVLTQKPGNGKFYST